LRIESSGQIALRSAPDAEAVTWTDRGAWRFTGIAEEDVEALRGLEAGLASALGPEPRPAEMLDDDKHSLARLLVDTHADAPWRHVLWTVASACARELRVWRLTFLVPATATWVDVDLPREHEGIVDYIALPVCAVEVRLFRRDLGSPGMTPFTRLKLWIREKKLVGPILRDLPPRQLEPKVLTGGGGAGSGEVGRTGDATEPASLDLPPGTATSAERTAALQRLTKHVAQCTSELPLLGVIKTPPPTGGAVPCIDVIEVLVRLREAGCETLQLEGAPPPMLRRAGAGR
jgi:hypothetical protein